MRIITLLTLLILFSGTRVNAYSELDFKRHTFEVSVAAGLDHQFIVRRNTDPVMAQLWKDSERPFAGFCFGLHYIYRPIRIVGISTGFESLEYGNKIGKTENYNGNGTYTTTAVFNGYGFNGSIGVPIYAHIYQQIGGIELEFITGPEFFFDVYSMEKYHVNNYNNPFGLYPGEYNIHNTVYYNGSQIKQSSSLAWSVQLMADVPVKKAFIVSIGPEWKFLDLKQLAPGNDVDHSVPRELPFLLGIKVGFRLGSNFYKKAGKTVSKS